MIVCIGIMYVVNHQDCGSANLGSSIVSSLVSCDWEPGQSSPNI